MKEDGVLVTWFKTADRMAENRVIDGNSEDDTGILFEEDFDDEYDDDLDDETIISEDDLEKIMSINELLPVEDETDEAGPVEIEESDDLELLEEERLSSSFLLEPDFEELDEGLIEEFEKEDSGEKEDGMEDIIRSWSTLE